MGNKAVSKEARRAAREAATAAQQEVIQRTKANVEDLAAFFDARGRAEAVDEWLAERQQALAEQAARRRAAQRLQCGTALRAMRDRGETLREIARMAGISEKAVRELIRESESPEPAPAPAAGPVGAGAAALPAPVSDTVGRNDVSAENVQADGRSWEPVPARA
jgi:anthranilate phosphoribosyltransferase